jgi:hypothetical protein
MDVFEFVLWAVFGFLFWRKALHLRFPALGHYLALRIISAPVLLFLFFGLSRHWMKHLFFDMYFCAYYAIYIASAVCLYFICVEVFRSALAGFSGLQRLGIVIFRWALLASVLIGISSISFAHWGTPIIVEVSSRIMRSVSILELCLLGFLCLSMNALRLPVRSLTYGIAVGFGIMSSSDFIATSFATRYTKSTDLVQFISEAVILLSLGVWIGWCAQPEPVRRPVLIAAGSTIYRWNEIASALGHSGTRVAMQHPANSFSHSDAEKMVEGALTRNLKGRESES